MRFGGQAAGLLLALALGACAPSPPADVSPGPSDDGAAILARKALERVQPRSIAEDREYCGLVVRGPDGALAATVPQRGGPTGCATSLDLPAGVVPVASYHTHAAYAEGYVNELPSPQDVASDMAVGTDGYVATPRGRLWRIDGETGTITLLCGPGCLPADAAAPEDGAFRRSITRVELDRALGL